MTFGARTVLVNDRIVNVIERGSNAGSNIVFSAWDDAGVLIDGIRIMTRPDCETAREAAG